MVLKFANPAPLANLTEINVRARNVTDTGLASSANLRTLNSLMVHARECSEAGIASLRKISPSLRCSGVEQKAILPPAALGATRRTPPNIQP